VVLPTLSDAERLSERPLRIDAARLLLLGERLAQLVLLFFGEVGLDELEVVAKRVSPFRSDPLPYGGLSFSIAYMMPRGRASRISSLSVGHAKSA
jgi:hypothetical protein